MAPATGSFPLYGIVDRKKQRPRQAKTQQEIEQDDKLESELKAKEARYKEVLDKQIEAELEKVDDDKLEQIAEAIEEVAVAAPNEDQTLSNSKDMDNHLRLDFYR